MRAAKWIKTVATKATVASVLREFKTGIYGKVTPPSERKSALAYLTAKHLRRMAMDEWYRQKNTSPPRLAKVARVRRQTDGLVIYWDFKHG